MTEVAPTLIVKHTKQLLDVPSGLFITDMTRGKLFEAVGLLLRPPSGSRARLVAVSVDDELAIDLSKLRELVPEVRMIAVDDGDFISTSWQYGLGSLELLAPKDVVSLMSRASVAPDASDHPLARRDRIAADLAISGGHDLPSSDGASDHE